MKKAVGYAIGILAVALAGAAVGAGGYWRYSGPSSTQLRWNNATEVTTQSTHEFAELLSQGSVGRRLQGKDLAEKWKTPAITVYSAPYVAPHPAQVTLKDLSDNGQAHAIDVVFKGPVAARTAWQELMNTVSDSAAAAARVDPYRVNRVLIATVAKGLDTLPGDRLLWTRVLVQPINFEFAGYTVAATDSRSVKIARIENSTNTKLSIGGGVDADLPGVAKPDVGQSIEKSQKASADVNEQYQNLGVDIQRDFLRIIRESAPGGDVAGNAAIQLSMLTDPQMIWCDKPHGSCEPRPIARPSQDLSNGAQPDDKLVLFVSSFHPVDGEADPRIAVLPQNPLPHCPLNANVWMLYEKRTITKGRQNYVEGLQEVELIRDGYDAGKVEIVAADDIAPAVWSIKVTDSSDTGPVTDDKPDLKGQTENGSARRLVFTDYLTASELAHWLKTQLAAKPHSEPRLKTMTFHADPRKTLTPFKHGANDCEPEPQKNASR